MTDNREQNGRIMSSQVKRIDEHAYSVKSQTGNDQYDILSTVLTSFHSRNQTLCLTAKRN
jgi:hypothetical protein